MDDTEREDRYALIFENALGLTALENAYRLCRERGHLTARLDRIYAEQRVAVDAEERAWQRLLRGIPD